MHLRLAGNRDFGGRNREHLRLLPHHKMQLLMQLRHHQPNTLSIFAEVVLVHIFGKFEVCTFFKSSISATAPVILKASPANSKPPPRSCKVNSKDIQTQPLPTLCNSHLLAKRPSKGTGAWQKMIQSLQPQNTCINLRKIIRI